VQLRILPLGASIVWGLQSTDGNGFRYGLRNQLIYGGNPVNMIGSVQHGDMVDNDVEGWPGYVITQVAQKAELSIPSQPNVVLLHVGTNDMDLNMDVPNAHIRLGVLIDRLFDAIPGVTVIASTLLPNGVPAVQANVNIYNSNIPGMLKLRQQAGKKLTYVDFSSSWFSTSDLNADGTHPTDAGYQKMAAVWYQGIQVADKQGWLTPPAVVAGVSDGSFPSSTTCDKIPGNAIGPVQTQMGSGQDDGPYVHTASHVGSFTGFNNPAGVLFGNPLPEGVYWADIDGDGSMLLKSSSS
jgi:lysophospholipase L1-like esterase